MYDSKQSTLLFAVLVLWLGCGKADQADAAEPRAPQPKKAADSPFALELDGTSSYVVLPDLKVDWNSPFTLEAWVTPSDLSQHREFLCNAQASGVVIGFYRGTCAFLLHDGKQYRRVLALRPAVLRKEVHVAGVFDGRMLHLYIDGKRQGKGTPFASRVKPSPYPLHIGANPETDDRVIKLFAGIVDEVRVSDTVRYQGEFKPARRFKPDAKTKALYHFDKGSGTIAHDESANKHDGTIRRAKWVTPKSKTQQSKTP